MTNSIAKLDWARPFVRHLLYVSGVVRWLKVGSTHNLNSYSSQIILQSKLFDMYLVRKKGQETLSLSCLITGPALERQMGGGGVCSYIRVLLLYTSKCFSFVTGQIQCKSQTGVKKSVTTVRKCVAAKEPIKFEIAKQAYKIS